MNKIQIRMPKICTNELTKVLFGALMELKQYTKWFKALLSFTFFCDLC